jgi:rRNA processing protein Gar1
MNSSDAPIWLKQIWGKGFGKFHPFTHEAELSILDGIPENDTVEIRIDRAELDTIKSFYITFSDERGNKKTTDTVSVSEAQSKIPSDDKPVIYIEKDSMGFVAKVLNPRRPYACVKRLRAIEGEKKIPSGEGTYWTTVKGEKDLDTLPEIQLDGAITIILTPTDMKDLGSVRAICETSARDILYSDPWKIPPTLQVPSPENPHSVTFMEIPLPIPEEWRNQCVVCQILNRSFIPIDETTPEWEEKIAKTLGPPEWHGSCYVRCKICGSKKWGRERSI